MKPKRAAHETQISPQSIVELTAYDALEAERQKSGPLRRFNLDFLIDQLAQDPNQYNDDTSTG
ncbi:MAG TPA: hypothetical protein VNE40_01580 [Candidatus Dormibacteraeota bacterium]|nr:hypothetical protein [Candidatus Dormibacteraeota bacterium]